MRLEKAVHLAGSLEAQREEAAFPRLDDRACAAGEVDRRTRARRMARLDLDERQPSSTTTKPSSSRLTTPTPT
jgi:hypothetical protein